MSKTLEVARILGTLRRANQAAGGGMGLASFEVLLLIAGGIDHSRDLMAATGRTDRSEMTKLLQFLEGRPVPGGFRCPPLRLIERRKHPHRAGSQFRLSLEGIALLRSTFTRLHTPEWS